MSAIQISQLERSNSIYELDALFQMQINGGFRGFNLGGTPPTGVTQPPSSSFNFSFNFSSNSTRLELNNVNASNGGLVQNGSGNSVITNNYYTPSVV